MFRVDALMFCTGICYEMIIIIIRAMSMFIASQLLFIFSVLLLFWNA